MQNTLAVIKSGANARIEMEMTFVKLCNPLLESSNDSLLARISALELAVKTGNISVKNVNSPSSEIKFETEKDFQDTSSISEKNAEKIEEKSLNNESFENNFDDKDNKTEKENRVSDSQKSVDVQTEERKDNSFVQQNRTAEYSDVQVIFPHWDELLDAVFKTDKALYSLLANSKGYIQSEFFLIDSPNESFSKFIKTENHLRNLRQAIFNITGQSYKVGFFKKSEPEKQKKDPLDSLIKKADGKIELKVE